MAKIRARYRKAVSNFFQLHVTANIHPVVNNSRMHVRVCSRHLITIIFRNIFRACAFHAIFIEKANQDGGEYLNANHLLNIPRQFLPVKNDTDSIDSKLFCLSQNCCRRPRAHFYICHIHFTDNIRRTIKRNHAYQSFCFFFTCIDYYSKVRSRDSLQTVLRNILRGQTHTHTCVWVARPKKSPFKKWIDVHAAATMRGHQSN